MDSRWLPYFKDTKRDDVEIFLHPHASISDVRQGFASGIDLSSFVQRASHTFTQLEVTLNWNYELFGPDQPLPNQILEARVQGLPLFIGIIESISSYNIGRGTRDMQLIAKSRDSFDIWRTSKRVTQSYPLLTELSYIASQIAAAVGLEENEIVLPVTPFAIPQTTIQLSDLSAWEMLTTILLPAGLTPFIDGVGRLRAAKRQLNARDPDLVLDDFVSVQASSNKPPTTRVQVKWLDPKLTKVTQQGRKLAEQTITMGYFASQINKRILFSADGTQRAENTYMVVIHSANSLLPVCSESYEPKSETTGQITLQSYYYTAGIIALALAIEVAAAIPDAVVTAIAGGHTISIGRNIQAAAEVALLLVLMSIGTGLYEIWGTPYDNVHARNLTEVFDKNAPRWIDNIQVIETDFIANESQAQQMAVTELVYQARAANGWNIKILDNLNLEYGDILQFPDGSQMYVEDIQRDLTRGSDTLVSVKGFLVSTSSAKSTAIPSSSNLITQTTASVKILWRLNSSSDVYTGAPTSSDIDYWTKYVYRFVGTVGYWDDKLAWAPNSLLYRDINAIYHPQDDQLVEFNPSFIYRDADGNPCFTDASATQYLCNQGNHAFQSWWQDSIDDALLLKGYKGVFIDDVNMDLSAYLADGTPVTPLNPNTGVAITSDEYRTNIVTFLENLRNTYPTKEFIDNSVWTSDGADPSSSSLLRRQILSCNWYSLRQGFTDTSLTGGSGSNSLRALFGFIDQIHGLARNFTASQSGVLNSDLFPLACFLLCFDSGDLYQIEEGANSTNPLAWPTINFVDVGTPLASRYEWNGLIRRDFSKGSVFVAPPGENGGGSLSSTMIDPSGNTVNSVNLVSREGMILLF